MSFLENISEEKPKGFLLNIASEGSEGFLKNIINEKSGNSWLETQSEESEIDMSTYMPRMTESMGTGQFHIGQRAMNAQEFNKDIPANQERVLTTGVVHDYIKQDIEKMRTEQPERSGGQIPWTVGDDTAAAKFIRENISLDKLLKTNYEFWQEQSQYWSNQYENADIINKIPTSIMGSIARIGEFISGMAKDEPTLAETAFTTPTGTVARGGAEGIEYLGKRVTTAIPAVYKNIKARLGKQSIEEIADDIPKIVGQEVSKLVRPEEKKLIKDALNLDDDFILPPDKDINVIPESGGTPIPPIPKRRISEKDFEIGKIKSDQQKSLLTQEETAGKIYLNAFGIRKDMEITGKVKGWNIEQIAKEIDGAMGKTTGLEMLAKQQSLEAQAGTLKLGKTKFESKVPIDNIESETLFQTAKGKPKTSIIQHVKNVSEEMGHKFTRTYEHLANKAENAELINTLKVLEKQRSVVAEGSAREVGEILSTLDKSGYDIFTRKIIFDDLMEDVNKGLYNNKPLPFKFTPESLQKEIEKVNSVVSQSQALKLALDKRTRIWDDLKSEYVKALKPYKHGIEDIFKENYYRHDVLDYVMNNGIFGTGKKLKAPVNKGYMKGRTGYEGLYNTDYLEAEYNIMSQMKYDMEVAKALTKINNKENIIKQLQDEAAKKGIENWKTLIPEGYETWQPERGSVFYPVMSISEKTATKIMEDQFVSLGDDILSAQLKKELKEVLAVGGRRPEWVVRKEVAATLDDLTRGKMKGLVSSLDLGVMDAWKKWQLMSPRRFFKYNVRNMSGDAEITAVGNPSAFLELKDSIKDLFNVFYRKKEISGDLKEFFERGGFSGTLQAQEMDTLKELWMFTRLHEKKGDLTNAWRIYWQQVRKATDFRESILRYANYKSYKKQLIGGNGKPKNYGASKPEMIDALEDIQDKAYWLSNDLLGAYDKISVAGHVLRERAIPFWSYKEANFRRYIQLFRNAANDDKLTVTIGRKLGAKTPFAAMKLGKMAIKIGAFTSALTVYNNTIHPEEEKEIGKALGKRNHIILGRDENGDIEYFSRLGAFDDFASFFGMDTTPALIADLAKGRDFKEVLKEQAKNTITGPVNFFVQPALPGTKLAIETFTRRSLFPDIFKPSTVRDRALNFAKSFGLENEYKSVAGLPSKGYSESLKDFFIYKVDPGEAAYRDIQDLKSDFVRKEGKGSEGFWLTPAGDAIYNMKLAIKYKDKKAFSDYYSKLMNLYIDQEKKGIAKSIIRAFKSMNPLVGFSSDRDRNKFIASLDEDEKERLDMAMDFYIKHLKNIGEMDFNLKDIE